MGTQLIFFFFFFGCYVFVFTLLSIDPELAFYVARGPIHCYSRKSKWHEKGNLRRWILYSISASISFKKTTTIHCDDVIKCVYNKYRGMLELAKAYSKVEEKVWKGIGCKRAKMNNSLTLPRDCWAHLSSRSDGICLEWLQATMQCWLSIIITETHVEQWYRRLLSDK